MKRKQADTLDTLLGKLHNAGFVVIPFHNLRECREIESIANVSLVPLCNLLEGETEHYQYSRRVADQLINFHIIAKWSPEIQTGLVE